MISVANKLYWNKLKADGLENIKLTVEDFIKLLDCYFGNIFVSSGDGTIL